MGRNSSETSVPSTLRHTDLKKDLGRKLTLGEKLSQLKPVITAQDWIGPNDPKNPKNWSYFKSVYHAMIPTSLAFVVSLGTCMISPSISSIAKALQGSNKVILLGFSSYLIGLAFGPFVGSPLSKSLDRRAVYLISIPMFILFTIGAGFSTNIESVIILRFFAGAFSSAVLVIDAGTSADLYPPKKRSTMTTLFTLGPFFPTGVGSVIGAYVNGKKDWRWVPWTLVFFTTTAYLFSVFQSETYKKKIPQRRAQKLSILPPPTLSSLSSLRHALTVVRFRSILLLCTH